MPKLAGLGSERWLAHGRVYVVYTKEQQNESDNTDIYVRYSDDNGATWSAGVRVNDDNTRTASFWPRFR